MLTVFLRLRSVPMRRVSMVAGLLMITRLVMLRRLGVVARCVLVVLGGLLVMIGCFFRHLKVSLSFA